MPRPATLTWYDIETVQKSSSLNCPKHHLRCLCTRSGAEVRVPTLDQIRPKEIIVIFIIQIYIFIFNINQWVTLYSKVMFLLYHYIT